MIQRTVHHHTTAENGRETQGVHVNFDRNGFAKLTTQSLVEGFGYHSFTNMPKSHKKRDRGDDSTATEPEPSHSLPESGPVAANSGSADPKPSRADRRKAKKLRKQLERDERGTVADPVPEESSGCVVSAPGAKLAFEIQRWSTDKKQRFDFIQVEVR